MEDEYTILHVFTIFFSFIRCMKGRLGTNLARVVARDLKELHRAQQQQKVRRKRLAPSVGAALPSHDDQGPRLVTAARDLARQGLRAAARQLFAKALNLQESDKRDADKNSAFSILCSLAELHAADAQHQQAASCLIKALDRYPTSQDETVPPRALITMQLGKQLLLDGQYKR